MKLLAQVRAVLRTKHYSPRTEETYVDWVQRYVRFHGVRHPAELGEREVARFLSDLAVRGRVAASTQNQALSALLFLYREVLGRDVGELDQLVRAKRPARLPVVLSRAEVKAVLGRLGGTTWLVASLLYGSGLRLLECLRLRVKDVDPGRNTILVRSGKGDRDRVTVFPVVVKGALEAHLKQVRRLWESDLADRASRSCCRTRWPGGIPTRGGGGRGSGCFRRRGRTGRRGASCGGTICTRRWCSGRLPRRCVRPASTSARAVTRCGTASPRICSRPGMTSARY